MNWFKKHFTVAGGLEQQIAMLKDYQVNMSKAMALHVAMDEEIEKMAKEVGNDPEKIQLLEDFRMLQHLEANKLAMSLKEAHRVLDNAITIAKTQGHK